MDFQSETFKQGDNSIPIEFICPISKLIMLNPVIDKERNIYDKYSILRWLENNESSPLTRKPLTKMDLSIHTELHKEIWNYIKNAMVNEEFNLDILNKLITELEGRKDETMGLDIASSLKFNRNKISVKEQNLKHTKYERIFNKLFDNGSIVYYNQFNIFYILDLEFENDLHYDLSKTRYNSFTENISGKLELWNLNMNLIEYTNFISYDSSDSDCDDTNLKELEQKFEEKKLDEKFNFNTKSEVIELLKRFENKNFIYFNKK